MKKVVKPSSTAVVTSHQEEISDLRQQVENHRVKESSLKGDLELISSVCTVVGLCMSSDRKDSRISNDDLKNMVTVIQTIVSQGMFNYFIG